MMARTMDEGVKRNIRGFALNLEWNRLTDETRFLRRRKAIHRRKQRGFYEQRLDGYYRRIALALNRRLRRQRIRRAIVGVILGGVRL